MTQTEINNSRNEKGVFFISNETAGWYAVSRDGMNMIYFYQGKWTFSVKEDVIRFYKDKGFSQAITKLLNGAY